MPSAWFLVVFLAAAGGVELRDTGFEEGGGG